MGKRKTELNGKNKLDVSYRTSLLKKKEIIVECEKLFQISSISLNTNQLWENYLEISRILEKIKKLEGRKSDLSERSDEIEVFVNWLKLNGANIDGVSIYNFPNFDFGLRAEVDFKENELILEIPRKLIFNVYTAASELKDMQTDMLIQHMPHVALAIALLIEKHKDNSTWKPYLNTLPRKYCTVLYMSADDMIELKGSPALESALKQCRNIARQYSYFKKLLQNSENSVSKLLKDVFTYEEYRWAVSTIMTRQNIIPGEKSSLMVHSLIPMWDMCNHEEGKITTDFNEISNCCECYAMRNFKSGDQIFIYYGPRTNTEFFVHSGFVYPDNKNDAFQLRLGISKADPLQTERVELLSKIGIPSINDYLLKPEQKPVSGLLLGFLRIFNMNKNELNFWLKSNDSHDILKSDTLLTETSDKTVLTFLITRIKLLLSTYRTLEQDEIVLQNGTLQHCRKLVLQMKLSEKKILNSILKVLENCEKL